MVTWTVFVNKLTPYGVKQRTIRLLKNTEILLEIYFDFYLALAYRNQIVKTLKRNLRIGHDRLVNLKLSEVGGNKIFIFLLKIELSTPAEGSKYLRIQLK